ncbi:hypothetical protein C2S51_005925 [Perilla frutescens var. frutescens]|nr:hypothetical protein C2S51_005925 [Perilla frutescens var. frutescens]
MGTPWNLIFPAIIFCFFFVKKRINSQKKSVKLPPGPKPLPIIGNLNLITFPPFRSFRDLSKHYGPIMHLKLGEASAVVVSSPGIAKQILKDHDPIFANRPQGVAVEIMWYNYVDVAFSPYGDYWKQMRKICINELLSPRMVRSFGSIRSDEASRLVDSIHHFSSTTTTVNLTERIFLYTSSITCRAAFGKVCKDREMLIKLMADSVKMVEGFPIADLFPSSRIVRALSWTKLRLKMMRRQLDVILDRIIDEHREKINLAAGDRRDSGNGEFGSEDVVDVFLRIMEQEKLQFPIGNDNIKAVLYDIFSAGTETSSTMIDWAMVELVRNPQVMEKAQAEVRQVVGNNINISEENLEKLKYLKLVMRETLRLHPPTPILPRASREECEINGYIIPAKMNVMVNVWAMHRDPHYWNDPEKFEPQRFENIQTVDFPAGDFQFLPFGTGRRVCPGIMFGLTTVELALAHLLYNFHWKLPQGVRAQDLDMIENSGLAASRKHNLFLVATPY